MLKISRLICAFLFFLVPLHILTAASYPKAIEYIFELIDFDEFKGDEKGKFAGDFIAKLSDGSVWKVHPNHKDLFSQWKLGEQIHVGYRTSKYYFSRQHKFYLQNHARNEQVFVMLIDTPHKVDSSSYPFFTNTSWKFRPPYGADPLVALFYWEKVPDAYYRTLFLSDGKEWVIDSCDIEENSPAYVGFNEAFFVILGTGVEAKMFWARDVAPSTMNRNIANEENDAHSDQK